MFENQSLKLFWIYLIWNQFKVTSADISKFFLSSSTSFLVERLDGIIISLIYCKKRYCHLEQSTYHIEKY